MSFKRYPRYKDSGVEWLGMVPEGWRIDRLKWSTKGCKNGVWGDEPKQNEDDIPCVRVADFDRRGLCVRLEEPTIRNVSPKDRHGRVLTKNDLLLEKSGGGESQPVGCVVLYADDRQAICSNFVAKVTVAAKMDPSFWRYSHAALYAIRINIRSIKQTSGIQNLDSGQYFDEKVCFPSLAEQSAISSFLDHETSKIDALISEQEKLIELLKEKRSAVISHAVTKGLNPDVKMKDSGVEWLGMVPEHWEVLKLGNVASTKGGAGFPDEYQGQTEEELPFFKVGDISSCDADGVMRRPNHTISRETARLLRATVFDTGTIVFAKVGAALLLQRYRQLGQPSCIDNNMMGMTVGPSAVPDYLLNVLPLLDLKTIVNPGAVPSINESQISGQRIAIPPIEEQGKIVEKLKDANRECDNLIRESESAINLLQERRSALISAAVTGRIDVRT
jgi:type I restriction enzyme S subunit